MQNNIKYYRTKAGLSQQELADVCGTVKSKISALENGKQQLTQNWMEKIVKGLAAHSYHIAAADLLPDTDLPEQEEVSLNTLLDTAREEARRRKDDFTSEILKMLIERNQND